ncbi:MAG: T9SS C-terminal target domain-containing protein [Ignavibacteriales bacterium]|nr:MAG: T9SS C-terminal target domain-containing protein [Ignavibacteriales bacterium]
MPGYVSLRIFDVLGNEVVVLVDEFRPAGRYETTFDVSLASGIYFYRIQAEDFVETKKI